MLVRIIKRVVRSTLLIPPVFLTPSSLRIASFKLISIHRFPAVPNQFTAPRLNLFQTPTHNPVVLLVYPGSEEVLLVNLVHLVPKRRPVFPLDYGKEKGKEREAGGGSTKTRKRRRTLVDATQGLSISQDVDDDKDGDEEADNGNVYADNSDTDPESNAPDQEIDKTPVLNGREEVDPPELEGWKIDIKGWVEQGKEEEGEEYGQERGQAGLTLMNCALGMGGRVIVGVGSASSVWVWNLELAG
jgi:polycomb protein EED